MKMQNGKSKAVVKNKYSAHERLNTEKFSFLGDLKDKKVLDMGGGKGHLSLRFSKEGARVVIMDINRQYMQDFKTYIDAGNSRDISVIIGDAQNLPFKDGYFDVVYAGGVFHHLLHIQFAIREVYRVLNMGGKLYADDPNRFNIPAAIARKLFKEDYDPNERRLTSSELERSVSHYFKDYSIRTFYPFFTYLISFFEEDVNSIVKLKVKRNRLKLPNSLKIMLDKIDEKFEKLPLFKNTGALILTMATK